MKMVHNVHENSGRHAARTSFVSNSKGAWKIYAPFLVAVMVSLIYHIGMKPMGGDDVFFSQATADKPLWTYLTERYETWTSRVVLEFLLVTVIQAPLLWRILDFLAFATLPILLAGIFGNKNELMNWCATAAVLLYPFHDMGTAGWITTTVTHFWPLWCFFFVCLVLKKVVTGERIPVALGIGGVLASVVTGGHEQWAVVLFVVLVLCAGKMFLSARDGAGLAGIGGQEASLERDGQKTEQKGAGRMGWYIAYALINLASLIVILLCPGNAARNEVSIHDLPIYAEFHFGEKLYLGLLSIERVFIANVDAVFLTVVLIWVALVYVKTHNYRKTLFSALPLLILFGQAVVRTAYPGLSGIFVMPGEILEWSWGELSTWIPMVYLAITLASMLYALYILLGQNVWEYICALLLLGCGFGAGAVVGFMATIYVSGERVYAALYMALLCVTLHCIFKMRVVVCEKIKQTGGRLFVTVLALICLVNIGFIALSV